MDDREQRIRERAYHLWMEEGRPHGRHADHWVLAGELIAIEENQAATLIPLDEAPAGTPVEPIEALENAGEFPTTTDQGEMQVPHLPGADAAPADAAPAPAEPVGKPRAAAKTAKSGDKAVKKPAKAGKEAARTSRSAKQD
ncbi:DUF2934 domain-containing protein [Ancylobacter sp. 6x-1]|uniref:DUF2934 domain-containing protein n=1 Tax=Ancylobacter crimeensis TaxID=2579147 RepID=A0ABT0DAF0_9HYPH|nr:DUF2934 domain-containing protein [Ancylobacter crimeensis]MCK0196934.1 DUF2934 domain-containing protein [Ancylobacter crimeensis]